MTIQADRAHRDSKNTFPTPYRDRTVTENITDRRKCSTKTELKFVTAFWNGLMKSLILESVITADNTWIFLSMHVKKKTWSFDVEGNAWKEYTQACIDPTLKATTSNWTYQVNKESYSFSLIIFVV